MICFSHNKEQSFKLSCSFYQFFLVSSNVMPMSHTSLGFKKSRWHPSLGARELGSEWERERIKKEGQLRRKQKWRKEKKSFVCQILSQCFS